MHRKALVHKSHSHKRARVEDRPSVARVFTYDENATPIRYSTQDFGLTSAFVCNRYGGRPLVDTQSGLTYFVLHGTTLLYCSSSLLWILRFTQCNIGECWSNHCDYPHPGEKGRMIRAGTNQENLNSYCEAYSP